MELRVDAERCRLQVQLQEQAQCKCGERWAHKGKK